MLPDHAEHPGLIAAQLTLVRRGQQGNPGQHRLWQCSKGGVKYVPGEIVERGAHRLRAGGGCTTLLDRGQQAGRRPTEIEPDRAGIDSELGIVLGGGSLERIQQRADFAGVIRVVKAGEWQSARSRDRDR